MKAWTFLVIAIATGIEAYTQLFEDRGRQDIPITDAPVVDPDLTNTSTTNPSSTLNPSPTSTVTPFSTPPPIVPPGKNPVILNAGETRNISSTGFGTGFNSGGEILTWQFQANNCRLDATCPCVTIPASWNCLDGYLKLRTGILWDLQTFCGGNRPNNFLSHSGELSVRYRSSSDRRSRGFFCFISCTAFGQNRRDLPNLAC